MPSRAFMFAACLVLVIARSARAACTSQGHPSQATLTTTVVEVLDDAAYRAGRDVWVPSGVKADSQIFAWLVWSEWATGRGCQVTLVGRRNDTCGPRVDVQFQQPTDFNAGVMVSDMASGNTTRYPYSCGLTMTFHIQDSNGNPVRAGSRQTVPDPGFDVEARVSLQVGNIHYEVPGGVPSVPPGMQRNGRCPEPKAGDAFPSFMLTGPGCPGPTGVRNNPASSSSTASETTWQGVRAATPSSSAAPLTLQSVEANRSAARARLSDVLGQVAAQTAQQNGRPVLVGR